MFKIFSSDPAHDPINKQAPATEIKKRLVICVPAVATSEHIFVMVN